YGSAGLTLAAGIFLQDPTSARYLDCSGPAHPCVPIIDNLQTGVAQIADNLQKGCGCNPSYPFKSQAFFPQGPKDNSYDAGGGLTVGGQSITFDSTGFHAGGQSQDPFGKFAKSLIDQYLTPNGISISVAPPVVTKNAGTGSINGSSLVITLNAQGMEKIVKNIPEPYRTWLQSPGSSPLAPALQQFST